ncbi:MAG: DUF1343 domain-containing protein, partial [Bacteroidales bacterium]|nr:DUF1343 domain-containing protein [Bacteroidales bacterium]
MTGLEQISRTLPREFKGNRIGVLCHAPSITKGFKHITDVIYESNECTLSAIFGPQHGIFGETQDNMIEWNSHLHPY